MDIRTFLCFSVTPLDKILGASYFGDVIWDTCATDKATTLVLIPTNVLIIAIHEHIVNLVKDITINTAHTEIGRISRLIGEGSALIGIMSEINTTHVSLSNVVPRVNR